MSDTTIEARWVAAGVGLPPMWWNVDGSCRIRRRVGFETPDRLDLADHQTRAGLLRRLAMWAGDDGDARAYWLAYHATGWTLTSPDSRDGHACTPGPFFPDTNMRTGDAGATKALARIVEAVGMDAHIRRALKYWDDPAPGTLATLEPWRHGGWVLGGDRFSAWFVAEDGAELCSDTFVVHALKGVTDPHEARCVIAEAL